MCAIQLSSKAWEEWRHNFYAAGRNNHTSLGKAFVQDHAHNSQGCTDLEYIDNNCDAEQFIKERYVQY